MVEQAESSESAISSDFPFILHRVDVLGSEMTSVDTDPDRSVPDGPTILFLHGNPTSSYLWRNMIPHVSPLMRCVAPDLIGMGHSSKPTNLRYSFTDHNKFLSTFIETVLPSGPVLIVAYDWGSALGLHWACQQAELSTSGAPCRILGLALMEFLRPFPDWEYLSEIGRARELFKAYRSPETGRKLIIDNNHFVESTLPGGVIRNLTEIELETYRRPFLRPIDRESTYAWPNQIPINHHPAKAYDIATRFHDWLMNTEVQKLISWATPGLFITAKKVQWYTENLKNAKFIHLGQGSHFLPEDHPHKIEVGIYDWVVAVLTPRTI